MALSDEISNRAKDIFATQWSVAKGVTIPTPEGLKMANAAVKFDRATVLYADLDGSTQMVDTKLWYFAAEVYKSFLYAAGRIINSEGGWITAYDGDRVMGIFLGEAQTPTAARCALKINYAVRKLVQPALSAKYKTDFVIGHKVGIDTSELMAVKTGVRGDNDITWVGRAANYAAKLTAIDNTAPTWLTAAAFSALNDSTWYGGAERKIMWSKWRWDNFDNSDIYSSNWTWTV